MAINPYTISTDPEDLSIIPGVRFAAVVNGCPRALGRPVFRHNPAIPARRNQIRVVNPTRRFQLAMRAIIVDDIGQEPHPFFDNASGGVTVNLSFFMPRPNCHFFPDRPRLYENLRPKFKHFNLNHVVRPDIDNLVKFVLDLPLTGTVFGDDKLVVKLNVAKKYDSVGDCQGRTKIEVLANTINLVNA